MLSPATWERTPNAPKPPVGSNRLSAPFPIELIVEFELDELVAELEATLPRFVLFELVVPNDLSVFVTPFTMFVVELSNAPELVLPPPVNDEPFARPLETVDDEVVIGTP